MTNVHYLLIKSGKVSVKSSVVWDVILCSVIDQSALALRLPSHGTTNYVKPIACARHLKLVAVDTDTEVAT
jgi:hypothetical protein